MTHAGHTRRLTAVPSVSDTSEMPFGLPIRWMPSYSCRARRCGSHRMTTPRQMNVPPASGPRGFPHGTVNINRNRIPFEK